MRAERAQLRRAGPGRWRSGFMRRRRSDRVALRKEVEGALAGTAGLRLMH